MFVILERDTGEIEPSPVGSGECRVAGSRPAAEASYNRVSPDRLIVGIPCVLCKYDDTLCSRTVLQR